MDQAVDTRCLPFRDGIAAEHLRGQVEARKFVVPQPMRVREATLPLHRLPQAGSPYETECLYGENVDCLSVSKGWALVQARADGYVGYVRAEGLGPQGAAPTHKIIDLRAFLYPTASIKATPLGFLPYGAEIAVEAEDGNFAATQAGFIYRRHLAPLTHLAADPVAEAERFLGIPYLWGGKSSLGIDCSGLVQTVHRACGVVLPRDSDMQEATFGNLIAAPETPAAYCRGDLLFWPGHVAIAQGNGLMIHANGHAMKVTSELIMEALARIAAESAPLRSVRRLLTNA